MTRPTDTRTRLLFAACKAIERGGEASVNVHKIAKAAGVTVPSLYHHYGSRDGLVEEAQAYRYEEGMRTMAVRLQSIMNQAKTKAQFRDQIETYLKVILSDENADFRRVRVSVLVSAYNNPRLVKRIVSANRAYVERLASYLTPAFQKGWIPKTVNIESLIFWTTSVLNGRVIIELDSDKTFEAGWNQMYIDSTMRALGFD